MAEAKPRMIYNTPRFKVRQYDWDLFMGPAAGQPAPDFTVTDFDGTEVKLSDYRGGWVVLETGSSTCSMYTKNIPDMKALAAEYPDVEFLVIYVREAHPGERLREHRTFNEKISAAKLLKPRYKEFRRVLIDSLEGDMHRAYGVMPNVIYVINPEGVVHYRCNWATAEGLADALGDRENLHTVENASWADLNAARSMHTSIRTMWTGGGLALWDFVVAGPALARRHKLVDDYYKEHGRFKQQPGG
jgi:hypothetical protein